MASNNSSIEIPTYVTFSDVVLGLFLAPIFLFVYLFLLFVLLVERKHFRKPYYYMTIGLGFCHTTMLFRYVYSFIISLHRGYLFGEFFDGFMAAMAWSVGWHSVLTYQIFIGVNRFVAVVFYEKYKTIFTSNFTLFLVVICYASGLFSIAPLLVNHRMKYDFVKKYNVFVPDSDSVRSFYCFDLVYACFAGCTVFILYVVAISVTKYKLKHLNFNLSRTAFIKEVKLMMEGFLVALTLVCQEVTFYFEFNTVITLTFMLLHSGMTPFIYLSLDRKLRKYFLSYTRCECRKRVVYR